jgi:hypothetical protein
MTMMMIIDSVLGVSFKIQLGLKQMQQSLMPMLENVDEDDGDDDEERTSGSGSGSNE